MARLLKTLAAILLPGAALSGCKTSACLGRDIGNAGDKFERLAH